jgi:hypothetical protein
LEQIAKESVELHRPVMEILTAFLRDTPRSRRWGAAVVPRLRTDFQAIATVLGRRDVSHDPENFRLDLMGVRLSRANLRGRPAPEGQLPAR